MEHRTADALLLRPDRHAGRSDPPGPGRGIFLGRREGDGGGPGIRGRLELVVIRMVQFCDPVQTDRYPLRVLPDGTLTELKSEVWRRTDGVCIRGPHVFGSG